METKTFLTVKQFAAKHTFITESSLRWYLFTLPAGFKECIRRLGRKILIDEAAVIHWIDQQREV